MGDLTSLNFSRAAPGPVWLVNYNLLIRISKQSIQQSFWTYLIEVFFTFWVVKFPLIQTWCKAWSFAGLINDKEKFKCFYSQCVKTTILTSHVFPLLPPCHWKEYYCVILLCQRIIIHSTVCVEEWKQKKCEKNRSR